MIFIKITSLSIVMTIVLGGGVHTVAEDSRDVENLDTQSDDILQEADDEAPIAETLQALFKDEVEQDTSDNQTFPDLLAKVETSLNSIALLADDKPSNYVTENNIAFDLPDLTIAVDTASGEFQMEAYKSIHNDKILTSEESKRQQMSQLIWVSVGQPMFAKTKSSSSNTEKLFHTSMSGFYTYVQMLTPAQKKMLAEKANFKYGINIGESQIVNLILSRFECSFVLFDEAGNKYLLKGSVGNFRAFPLRMDFYAPRSSIEWMLFSKLQKILDENMDLHFTCNMASQGKVMRTNTLSINREQIEDIGIDEKLFGKSPSVQDVFVTREQTTVLASEMYSTLNIVEEYQMQELQFSEAFVEGLINQVATSHFTMTPIDTVLDSLSKYGFDISGDLKADVIKRDAGQILKIEKKDSKSLIVLNEEHYKQVQQSSGRSGGGRIGFMGFGASARYARTNSQTTTVHTKSLKEQLNELNTLSQNDIKWDIEGEKVIPKSLNVARMSRSKLSTTLTFKRVRIQSFNAPFDRVFAVYTQTIGSTSSSSDQSAARITQLAAQVDTVTKRTTEIAANVDRMEAQMALMTRPSSGQGNSHNFDVQLNAAKQSMMAYSQQLVNALSVRSIKRCRVCSQTTIVVPKRNTQCKITCSPWSDSYGSGIESISGGKCQSQWKVECHK